jgi:hypothetical protein
MPKLLLTHKGIIAGTLIISTYTALQRIGKGTNTLMDSKDHPKYHRRSIIIPKFPWMPFA